MSQSKLERETIEMMAKNMSYIQLGLEKNTGDINKATWLYFLIKSYKDNVDERSRADAIEARNRLNAGYTKAGH